jgi:hypothetical protein
MSDDFEALLRRWLRDRAGNDRSALRALAGNVAVLPPRRPSRRKPLAVAASVIVVLGLIAFVVPRNSNVASDPEGSPPPTPTAISDASPSAGATNAATSATGLPDPTRFVGNPWFESCGGLTHALTAFVVPRARDLPLYLPALLRAPEVERDDPAFVLVYKGKYPGVVMRAPPPPGQTWPPEPTLAPNHHDMCVIVGPVTGAGSRGVYGDVSLEGFDPHPAGAASAPPPTTDAPPFPVWPGIAFKDQDGTPADPLVLAAFAGPQPCGWDQAAFLEIGWPFGSQALVIDNVRRYVRDPEGLFADGFILLDRLDLSAELPADAAYAGYRSGDIELWTSPTTIDKAVYLRWPDHVERWPRMENVAGCG